MSTVTFNYNGTTGSDGSIQSFIVPAYVTSIGVTLNGAGSLGTSKGGQTTGTLSVTPGSTLYICVGGRGYTYESGGAYFGVGGYGGGGNTDNQGNYPTPGAGMSWISLASSFDYSVLAVAGGAGGGNSSGYSSGSDGSGGGLSGDNGNGFGYSGFGLGGTQSSGGLGGASGAPTWGGIAGDPGSFGLGGNGGYSIYSGQSGGGGGGGYYGGGGGGSTQHSGVIPGSGGGGGSGYMSGYFSGTMANSVNSGAGSVIITYTIPTPVVPTVTTPTSTAITQTTATLGADVTNTGYTALTDEGICWSTSPSPQGVNVTSAGSTLGGVFTIPITGLPSNTLIYYCGYAVNSVGTSYSSVSSFTTLPTAPTITTQAVTGPFSNSGAIANGDLTSVGQASATQMGVCVGTSIDPDITDTIFTTTVALGYFNIAMTGLSINTLYHVRAFATNAGGTSYGADVTFTTTPPTITSINPNNAASTGSAPISSITGVNFVSGCTVMLTKTGQSNLVGALFTFTNSGLLSNGSLPTMGAINGLWNVVVTNPDGQTATLANGFSISTYDISDAPITLNASNYKWLTGSLLSAQQSASVHPYTNCQIINDSFTVTSEVMTSGNLLQLGASVNSPDGTILAIGRDSSGNLRFGKITDASQASQWSGLANGTSGTVIASSGNWVAYNSNNNSAMNPGIAVSNYINGTYVIDIYYWYVSSGKFEISQVRSTNGGTTFSSSQVLASTGIPSSTTQNVWLSAGQPIWNQATNKTSATVYHLNYVTNPNGAQIHYALNTDGASSWGSVSWCQWPLTIDSYDWNIHSFDVITIKNQTYIVWSGYHNSLGNSTNYGLYISRIYNLSGDSTISDAKDVWGEARPILTIEASTSQNAANFYYPTLSWDGEEFEVLAQGDIVGSIDDSGNSLYTTGYFLWSSTDLKNFTYPLQIIDTSGNAFPNDSSTSLYHSAYRLVPQSMRGNTAGNFYYIAGSGIVWQYTLGNTIADVSNYIISYSISEQAGAPASLSLTIANDNGQWYGTTPTLLGNAALKKGSKIYLKQGYFNSSGQPESVPKSIFYISDINQNVSVSENDLVITGVDYNYLLQTQTTKYTYNFIGPDFYNDIFSSASVASWSTPSGTWTPVINPSPSSSGTAYPQNIPGVFLPLSSGTINTSPVLNAQTIATLSGYTVDKQVMAMSVMAYIPSAGAGEVDIYPYYIDSNNYMKVSFVGASGSSITMSASGMCQGSAVSYNISFGTSTITATPNNWYTIYITKKFFQGEMMYMISLAESGTAHTSATDYVCVGRWIVSPASGNVFPQNSSPTIALGTNGTWSLTGGTFNNYGFADFKFLQYDYSQSIEELTKTIGNLAGINSYKSEHDFDVPTHDIAQWATSTATSQNNSLIIPQNGNAWYTHASLGNQRVEFDAKVSPITSTAEYAFDFLFRCTSSSSLAGSLALRFGNHVNSNGSIVSGAYIAQHDGGSNDSTFGGSQLYSTLGTWVRGTSAQYDTNPFFDLHIDWTQWHHYAVTFNAGWIYAYVDDRMVLAYYIDTIDLPTNSSGYIGFNTASSVFGGTSNASVVVKNIYAPTFWNQINAFSINTGDDFQNAIQSNLSTIYGYHFSDLAGRLHLLVAKTTDLPNYDYGSGASNYQLISQTIDTSNTEYVNEIVVIGDGVQAITQDTTSIGKNSTTRTLVVTDMKIQTLADAKTRAQQELASADKYGVQPSPKQTINVGSELFDVVNVVDDSTSNSTGLNGNYRIYVQSFAMGGSNFDYTMTFSTGSISGN